MSAEMLAELRAVAQAADADGRPWSWSGGYPQRVLREGDVMLVADCFEDSDSPSRFAYFIATFDPPTVLWLLDLLGEGGSTKAKPLKPTNPGIHERRGLFGKGGSTKEPCVDN